MVGAAGAGVVGSANVEKWWRASAVVSYSAVGKETAWNMPQADSRMPETSSRRGFLTIKLQLPLP